MGLGDIKLALPVGTMAAWIGWTTLYYTVALSFVLAAASILARRRHLPRQPTRRIAFGLYMLLATIIAVLYSVLR